MMTDKMQLDDALTKAETCLEKLSHLIESFTVMYNLNDTRKTGCGLTLRFWRTT